MSTMRALPLAALAIALASRAHAGTIRGRVLDARTRAPIAGAVVVWEDAVFAPAADDGTFRIDAPGAGII